MFLFHERSIIVITILWKGTHRMNIYSINDLLEQTSQFVNRHGHKAWFRGQLDFTWNLLPGVKRVPYNEPKHEQYMATNFYIEACKRMKATPKDQAGWICLMQHYGLPTRLLDLSESPLVALYFAVTDDEYDNVDAALWLLDPIALNENQGYGNYLPPMDYHSVLEHIEPAFKDYLGSPDKILACCSVENDLRMYVQQSTFTIHGSDMPLESIVSGGDILTKFVIPKKEKSRLRWDLDILGFRLSTIFPDIEHISYEIKHNFS